MSDQKLTSLAEAEKTAQIIIKDAKLKKAKMLEQAKSVAEREINDIKKRKQKDLDLLKFDLTNEHIVLEKENKESKIEVQRAYDQNAIETLNFVSDRVMTVNLQVFKNLVANFEPLKGV